MLNKLALTYSNIQISDIELLQVHGKNENISLSVYYFYKLDFIVLNPMQFMYYYYSMGADIDNNNTIATINWNDVIKQDTRSIDYVDLGKVKGL